MNISSVPQNLGDSSAEQKILLTRATFRIALAVFALSIVGVGLFFFAAYAQSMPLRYSANVVVGSAASTSATATIPLQEITIGNDGLTFIRGAMISEISGNAIHVSIEWGGANFNWIVNTDGNTKFFKKTGEKGSFFDLQQGDYIDITGMLAQGDSTPTVNAQFVRE
jgi:hypothetical protein